METTVLITGTLASEDLKNFLFSPHRLHTLATEQITHLGVGVASQHSFAISNTGRIFGMGRNSSGQLGLPETSSVLSPTLITSLSQYKIIRAACGCHHSVFVTKDGEVLSCGKNDKGQLGTASKSTSSSQPTLIPAFARANIQDISCGADFTVALDSKGCLWSWGQLKHGPENQTPNAGKSIFTPQPPTKIEGLSNVQIAKVCCGTNHVVALSKMGELYTWGFGGHGRLGHKEQKDECRPKKIEQFSPVTDIAVGGAFNLAVTPQALYTWGKTTNKGNVNMSPVKEQGLQGWKASLLGCGNTSLVVQADSNTIAWGMGTSGQLGMGEDKKSSDMPDVVTALKEIKIVSIGCTALHTLFIAEESSKTRVLPVYQELVEVEEDFSDSDSSEPEKKPKTPPKKKEQTEKTNKRSPGKPLQKNPAKKSRK